MPEASIDQVEAAVAAADKAFQRYGRTTPAARSSLLLQLADRIEAEAEAFARLEALNCGKPYHAVMRDEIPAIVDCFRFFAGAARVVPALARRIHRRLHLDGPARSDRRLRLRSRRGTIR